MATPPRAKARSEGLTCIPSSLGNRTAFPAARWRGRTPRSGKVSRKPLRAARRACAARCIARMPGDFHGTYEGVCDCSSALIDAQLSTTEEFGIDSLLAWPLPLNECPFQGESRRVRYLQCQGSHRIEPSMTVMAWALVSLLGAKGVVRGETIEVQTTETRIKEDATTNWEIPQGCESVTSIARESGIPIDKCMQGVEGGVAAVDGGYAAWTEVETLPGSPVRYCSEAALVLLAQASAYCLEQAQVHGADGSAVKQGSVPPIERATSPREPTRVEHQPPLDSLPSHDDPNVESTGNTSFGFGPAVAVVHDNRIGRRLNYGVITWIGRTGRGKAGRARLRVKMETAVAVEPARRGFRDQRPRRGSRPHTRPTAAAPSDHMLFMLAAGPCLHLEGKPQALTRSDEVAFEFSGCSSLVGGVASTRRRSEPWAAAGLKGLVSIRRRISPGAELGLWGGLGGTMGIASTYSGLPHGSIRLIFLSGISMNMSKNRRSTKRTRGETNSERRNTRRNSGSLSERV